MKQAVTLRSATPPDGPGDTAPTAVESAPSGAKGWHLALACAVLLGITWVPLVSLHLHRTSLGDDGTGTVVVIFPPTLSTRAVFRNIIDADGAIVRPVSWARQVWVARSVDPGFAGRLRRRGAWGVYSINLLSANALFSCLHIGRAPPAR